MLYRITFLFLYSTSLFSLEIVDTYIKYRDSLKAINRLFYLAKDERNFASNNFGANITPDEIFKRVEKVKNMVSDREEKRVIELFFEQKEIKRNPFITSYLLYNKKRYFETVQKCEEILRYYPDNLYALTYRAKASLKTTEHLQAEYSYITLIKLYPQKVQYRYQLLELYLKDNKVEKAKKLFKSIEKRFPKDKELNKFRKRVEEADSLFSSMFNKIKKIF